MTLYYFYFDGKYNFDDVESLSFSGKQFIRLDNRQISALSSIPTKHMKISLGSHMDEVVYAKIKFRILDNDVIKPGIEYLVSSYDIYESLIARYEDVKREAINGLLDKAQGLVVKSLITRRQSFLQWSNDNPNEYNYMQGNYVYRRGEFLDIIRETIKKYPKITINKSQYNDIIQCWKVQSTSGNYILLEGYEGVADSLNKILSL